MSDVQFRSLINDYLSAGLFSHVYAEAGYLDEDEPSYQMSYLPKNRSIFDLASLTKAMVTAPLAIELCRKEDIGLETTMRFLVDNDMGLSDDILDISIHDVLSHTSGLPAWRNLYIGRLNPLPSCQLSEFGLIERLNLAAKSKKQRGQHLYSDLGFIVLGLVLEKREGCNLSEQFQRYLDQDLQVNLRHLAFADVLIEKDRCITTGMCKIREKPLFGEVHDENCASLGGIAGHAGLFGTGEDCGTYLRALYTSEAGRHFLEKNYSQIDLNPPSLLGCVQGTSESAKIFGSGKAMGHLGFTGTGFWIDYSTKRYAVLLTNRVISGRVSSEMTRFRSQAFSLLSHI